MSNFMALKVKTFFPFPGRRGNRAVKDGPNHVLLMKSIVANNQIMLMAKFNQTVSNKETSVSV